MFKLKREIIEIGKIIYNLGFVDTHSGNISIKKDSSILITGTGTKLGFLLLGDIVSFNINSSIPASASSESIIHKSIYEKTDFNAIIHTHSFFSVLLSFFYKKIIPVDSEGLFFNPSVPVLDCGLITVGSQCVYNGISDLFQNGKCVIIKGHGVFSCGKDLDEALKHLSALENSCKLIYYKNDFQNKGRM